MDYTNLRLLSSKESVQVWLCEDECQNLYIQKIYNEKADSIQLNANFKLHSQLQHPGIPCALEIINEEKRTIVIYEYIYGLTLKKYLDLYGCVDEKTAVKWFIELLSILDYIHTALDVPVIHRDIKPSNIVIDGKGDLHLIDFGIARTFKNTHLKDTVVLGSHGFAPPEQYGLNQSDVRSDVFSAAVTIYYSVTGTSLAEPPYQVMPLSTKKGLYSRKFSEILVKAAMLNPSERYPTAASLKKDVEQHYKRITKPVQRFIVATFSIFLLLSILIFMVAFISNKVKYQNLPYPDSPAAFIADSRLKDALISAGVDYYQDGILTEEELRKSEIDLFLNNRGITDLTGMELMVNTVHLELQGNSINDHSPIHSMTALEILYLDDTGLESLEGFENMANLVLLSLGDNPVSDIKPLFALTRLHDLWLKNTLVTDITGIDSLINLRDFSFEGTGLNDITPLTNLKSMNRVDLRSCNIESITPLAGKTSITKLWIDGNKIDFSNPTEKSVLEGLIDLGVVVEFDPQNIPEADISSDVPASDLLDSSTDNFPYNEKQINYNMDINFFMALCKAGYDSNLDEFLTLEEMAAFKSDVDLSLNNIIDIDAARYLVNTETLRLAGNPIKDLAPLSNLYNLHMLLLSDVDLSHYDYFAFPENLETLYLDFCGIKSINQINNLPNLNFLSLTGNGMTTSSLSGLERFKNITSLSINDNAITDITSLVNLNNLSELTLYNNYIDFEDETQQNALNTLLNKGVSVEYEPQRFIPDPSSAPIVFNDDNLRLAL
ncbi:MAG: protein kinase, partial [Bacteroidales bacterium]|nr:protein kinase [Bacteroidales bacterium]